MRKSFLLSGFATLAAVGALTLASAPAANAQLILSQDFDADNATLTTAGWNFQNNSVSPSTTFFTSAITSVTGTGGFGPQSTTGFAVANFNSTTSGAATGATISQWMLTPVINIANGTTVSFFTRTTTASTFPDRLVVRLSTNGASTNTGGTANATSTPVGDFTTTLGTVNPTLAAGGYPNTDWTQLTYTISGIAAPTTGRIGFNYFVTNGGPGGANSNIIGVDTLRVNAITPAAAPEPGTLALLVPGLLGGVAVLRRRRK